MKFISETALNRVLKINWFSDIGRTFDMPDIIYAKSIDDLSALLSSAEWENTTLDARNKLANSIGEREYQKWNDVAKEARSFVDGIITDKIRKANVFGLGEDILLPDIKWNVLHYLIEDFYKHICKLKPPFFFEKVVTIYEKGHLACGWNGKYLEGNLIVY